MSPSVTQQMREKYTMETAETEVVKITEDVSGNRDTIMVPAEILGDFIAALSDIKETADN